MFKLKCEAYVCMRIPFGPRTYVHTHLNVDHLGVWKPDLLDKHFQGRFTTETAKQPWSSTRAAKLEIHAGLYSGLSTAPSRLWP